MNLQKLFEIQAKLDNRIVEEHGLQGQDLLDKKILALQVELGELANEHRGFKFWSNDQYPRAITCPRCDGAGTTIPTKGNISLPKQECSVCRGSGKRDRNPLLEEYVDCVHFTLSIGLELSITDIEPEPIMYAETVDQFNALFSQIGYLTSVLAREHNRDEEVDEYVLVWQLLFGLAIKLEFTEQQIYDAYMDKNKTNHTRQDTGY